MYVATYIDFFWFTASYYSSANAEDDKNFFQTKKYFPSSFFWLATSDENYEWNCPMDGYLNSHSPVVVGTMSVQSAKLGCSPFGESLRTFPFSQKRGRFNQVRFRKVPAALCSSGWASIKHDLNLRRKQKQKYIFFHSEMSSF